MSNASILMGRPWFNHVPDSLSHPPHYLLHGREYLVYVPICLLSPHSNRPKQKEVSRPDLFCALGPIIRLSVAI